MTLCNVCKKNTATEQCSQCFIENKVCQECSYQICEDCSGCDKCNFKTKDLEFNCNECTRSFCSNCVVRKNGTKYCPWCKDKSDELDLYMMPTKPIIRQKRPDNVKHETSNLKAINSSKIIINQALARLQNKYKLNQEFIDTLISTNSSILGSFNLEVIFAESYENSNLNIYCTENSLKILQNVLPNIYTGIKMIESNCKYVKEIIIISNVNVSIWFHLIENNLYVDNIINKMNISILQTKFNGKEFYIANEDILNKKGVVFGIVDNETKKYYDRGFDLTIRLNDDIVKKIF